MVLDEVKEYKVDFSDIKSIFALKRPSRGYGQQIMAAAIHDHTNGFMDIHGNVSAIIEDPNGPASRPRVMFTSHLDTVHKSEGLSNILYTGRHAYTNGILGADDGAGIYIMMKMFDMGVPGLYLWCVDEEIGRVGSREWRDQNKHLVSDLDLCVSFDRAGCDEVIYNQLMSDTGSRAAAAWVSDKLGNGYMPSPHGMFTDSYTFRFVANECLNIGVGYENAHTSSEFQDVMHLEELAEKCCAIRWQDCVISRNAAQAEIVESRFDKFSNYPDATAYRNSIEYGNNGRFDYYGIEYDPTTDRGGNFREMSHGDYADDSAVEQMSYEDEQLLEMIIDNPYLALICLKKHYDSGQLIGLLAGHS